VIVADHDDGDDDLGRAADVFFIIGVRPFCSIN
jgi:hypothetical protein